MAYETGIPTSAVDLLDKLRLFCIAQGWTVNRNANGTGYKELCIQKDDMFFNMKAGDNVALLLNGTNTSGKYGILLNGSDGYAAGNLWDQQPGYPLRATQVTNPQWSVLLPFVTSTGPFVAYHFFAPNANCIYVEVEVTTGCFHRLGFGKLDTFGTVAGNGRFFYGTLGSHETSSTSSSSWLGSHAESSSYAHDEGPWRMWSAGGLSTAASAVRCNVDSVDGWAARGHRNYNGGAYCPTLISSIGANYEDIIAHMGPSPLNGLSPMTPIIVSISRNDVNHSPLGMVPDIRYMSIQGLLPGEEFYIGPDLWKVFPLYQKDGRSYNLGIAYRKV